MLAGVATYPQGLLGVVSVITACREASDTWLWEADETWYGENEATWLAEIGDMWVEPENSAQEEAAKDAMLKGPPEGTRHSVLQRPDEQGDSALGECHFPWQI